MPEPTLNDVRDAHARIKPFIHRTPVLTCSTLNRMAGAELFFKCENFQKAGAFKIRGASNAVFSLTEDEAARGVATHSSGNHAAALALAARWRGVKAYVVMPENTPRVKRDAVSDYGAEIIFCKPTFQAREQSLSRVVERTGAVFVPPFNDYRIIAGQGTAALELCQQVENLDIVMAPVGGGGLLSGTAIAVSAISSNKTRVIGAEPENADDAYRSFRAGKLIPPENPQTVADGLRTPLGDLTFPLIKKFAHDIVSVSENDIIKATRLIWERMKIVVEPSAAVPLGALLHKPKSLQYKRIGIILSGGNINLPLLT